jgi:hypothetical protein
VAVAADSPEMLMTTKTAPKSSKPATQRTSTKSVGTNVGLPKATQSRASKAGVITKIAATSKASTKPQSTPLATYAFPRRKTAAKLKTQPKAATHQSEVVVERVSKQSYLIERLHHPEGATLVEMIMITGWQGHSIRGVISGILKKKLGLNISLIPRPDGTKAYRIITS